MSSPYTLICWLALLNTVAEKYAIYNFNIFYKCNDKVKLWRISEPPTRRNITFFSIYKYLDHNQFLIITYYSNTKWRHIILPGLGFLGLHAMSSATIKMIWLKMRWSIKHYRLLQAVVVWGWWLVNVSPMLVIILIHIPRVHSQGYKMVANAT